MYCYYDLTNKYHEAEIFDYTIHSLEVMTLKINEIAHNMVITSCPNDNDDVGSDILLIERKEEKSSNFLYVFL